MDTEDSNSTPQTERDKLNDQLDELRESQQESLPISTTSQMTPPVPRGRTCGGGCAPLAGCFCFGERPARLKLPVTS